MEDLMNNMKEDIMESCIKSIYSGKDSKENQKIAIELALSYINRIKNKEIKMTKVDAAGLFILAGMENQLRNKKKKNEKSIK